MVDAGPVITDPPGMHVANIRDDAQRLAAQIASQGPHSHAAYEPMTEAEIVSRRAGGQDTSMLRRPGLSVLGRETSMVTSSRLRMPLTMSAAWVRTGLVLARALPKASESRSSTAA